VTYTESHPWLTFNLRLDYDDNARLWTLLGEAYSKCGHLAGAPLAPAVARELSAVYRAKGAAATTAIEGNTLSETQVRAILDRRESLPPSQRYLQQEVENVLDALAGLADHIHAGTPVAITTAWLRDQNRLVLRDLDVDDHVRPGEYTTTQLVVGGYRGAPPEAVPYLMDRLTSWLDQFTKSAEGQSDSIRFFQAFLAATLGHLYFAWIHPFGDGNGRTARLLECAILTKSGVVPWVSTNLLSDHYNRTRTEYYRRLDAASKRGDVAGFMRYAAQGFVDMLREQIAGVQHQQLMVSWINYVHDRFQGEPTTQPSARARLLLFALPPEGVAVNELRLLTPKLAEQYAGKDDKTISRDVNKLVGLDLAEKMGGRIRPKIEIMAAFIPRTAGDTAR
jgi:Fic family protein